MQLGPLVWSWASAPQLAAVPGTEAAPYVGSGLESGLPHRPAACTLGLSPCPGAWHCGALLQERVGGTSTKLVSSGPW